MKIMTNMPDIEAIMKEVEIQLLEAVGVLEMAETDEWNSLAKAKLITTIHGLRVIYRACEAHPITIGEVQFNKAKEIRIEADKSRA